MGPYAQWKRVDAHSPRLCNNLKPHGVQTQRRVRRKSLYLGDSSDMNSSPDHITGSIAHVLNERAGTTGDECICPLRLAQYGRDGIIRCRTPTCRLSVMVPATDWLPGVGMHMGEVDRRTQ